MLILYVLLAILVGFGFATQTVLTAKVSVLLANPVNAVFLSILISVLAILGFKILSGNIILTGIRAVSPWLYISGGMLGAFSLTMLIFITPKLGISLAISIMIASQLILAVIFDHFGVLGLEVKPINLYKAIGIAFLLVGSLLCLYYR